MMAVGRSSLTDPSPPLKLENKQVGSQAKNNKKKGKVPKPSMQPPQKLYEQLGHEMINKLVQDLQVSHDTPTLLDRLRDLGLINVQASQPQLNPSTTILAQESPPKVVSQPFGFTGRTTLPLGLIPHTGGGALGNQSRNIVMSSGAKINSDGPKKSKSKDEHNHIFTLGDFAAVDSLSTLADSYGRVSHMGILDGSYSFFITLSLSAALCFKVLNNICVIGGDPLCSPSQIPSLLSEFAAFRKKHNWGILFIGASDTFLTYANSQKRKWTTIQFGIERVLNPVTSPILLESTKTSKRIASQNRQLLNPAKFGIKIGIYNPSIKRNLLLQAKLVRIYDIWRAERNENRKVQAFITVFDPFAILGLMTYIYAVNREGTPIGFAALRRIGANNGFHVDPCIALPDAPRGVTDLLIFASLSLLNLSGCNYLTFGYEPLTESGRIEGMPKWMGKMAKRIHKGVYKDVKVDGKKGYHDKWCPDEGLSGGLHIVFPDGVPGPQDILAVLRFVHISVRALVRAKISKVVNHRKDKVDTENEEKKAQTEVIERIKAAIEVSAPSKENIKEPAEQQSNGKIVEKAMRKGNLRTDESLRTKGTVQPKTIREDSTAKQSVETIQKESFSPSPAQTPQTQNPTVEISSPTANTRPAKIELVKGKEEESMKGRTLTKQPGVEREKNSMELAKWGAEGQVVEISVSA